MEKANQQTIQPENQQATPPSGRKDWWKPLVLLATVVVLLALAKYIGVDQWLKNMRGFIENLGALGPLVFILIYMTTTVFAVPGSAMTIIGGAIFGSIWGVVLVSIASTAGASLCFLIARYFARDATAQWLSQKQSFKKLDSLTEEHGAIIVALTRLTPIFPFNLLNYGFGLTRVPFWTYVLWSWLCMLPGTVLYVSAADAFTLFFTKGKISWPLIIAIVLFLIILTFLVRDARKRLRAKQAQVQ